MAEARGVVDREQSPPQSAGRRVRRNLILFLLLLLGIAAGSIYAATAVIVRVDNVLLPGVDFAVPRPISRVVPGLDPVPVEGSVGTARITILVLGLDRRPLRDPQVDGPPNSDSMHLISLDPVTRTAVAVALPRDLYVEMPSPQKKGEFWEARINSAYRFGEETKYPGGGAAFSKRVVEYTFRIPIDYYVVVDWNAFADVIDALGGVEVTVPTTMRNVEAYNPRDGNAYPITIPAGFVGMDAITALAYARFRDDAENDFGRIRRQQQVMRAAAERAGQLGWIGQGPQLYSRFRSAIDTDLSAVKLPGVINLIRLIGNDRLTTISLAGENTEGVRRVITPFGEDVLVPVWDVVGATLRTAIEDRALATENANVSVANGTNQRGLESRAAAYLGRFALPPARIAAVSPTSSAQATAAQPAATSTTISYAGEAAETARRVADWLGVPSARITKDPTVGAPPVVTVTLGPDVRLPDDLKFLGYAAR